MIYTLRFFLSAIVGTLEGFFLKKTCEGSSAEERPLFSETIFLGYLSHLTDLHLPNHIAIEQFAGLASVERGLYIEFHLQHFLNLVGCLFMNRLPQLLHVLCLS